MTETEYTTSKDIHIPAGTMLRRSPDKRGGSGYVECVVGHGRDFSSSLVVQVHPDAIASGYFKEVEKR